MNNKSKITFLILLFILILPISVFAHPGRTDSNGCHTCKKNCSSWGLKELEYHCHTKSVTRETKEARTEARQDANTQARISK